MQEELLEESRNQEVQEEVQTRPFRALSSANSLQGRVFKEPRDESLSENSDFQEEDVNPEKKSNIEEVNSGKKGAKKKDQHEVNGQKTKHEVTRQTTKHEVQHEVQHKV